MADNEDSDIASRQQVFDTAELLEHILLQLPVKDLLLDQRVCKTWKNCIDNSVKLQKGLFFRPAGEMTVEEVETNCQDFGAVMPRRAAHYRFAAKSCLINPLFIDKLGVRSLACIVIGENLALDLPLEMLHPQASWRRMSATQPPFPTIKLAALPVSVFTREEDGTQVILTASSDFDRRRKFSNDLEKIIQGSDVCTIAQDVEGLEAKDKASDKAGGTVGFKINFKQYGTPGRKGTSDDPYVVAAGDVFLSCPEQA